MLHTPTTRQTLRWGRSPTYSCRVSPPAKDWATGVSIVPEHVLGHVRIGHKAQLMEGR